MFSRSKAINKGRLGLGFSLRLSLYFGAFAALLALGIFAIAYLSIARSVRESEYRWLEEHAAHYRQWYRAGGLSYLGQRFREEGQRNGELLFVRLYGRGTEATYVSYAGGSGDIDFDQLRKMPLGNEKRIQMRFGEGDTHTWTIIVEPFADGLTIQLGRSLPGGAIVLKKFQNAVAWAAVPALLLGIVGGTWLTFRAMGPIRRLITTIRSILSTGDLEKRAETRSGFNELNALVYLFNQLLTRNQELVNAMRQSLDSVAHDLRTPMMRLRLTAESTLLKIEEPLAQEALGEVLEESDEILKILTLLMDLCEAESGTLRLDREEISVASILQAVVTLFEFVAEEKEISVQQEVDPNLTLQADPARLRQAVANLVDNAIKYSPPRTTVTLSAEQSDGDVWIRVRDQGKGIPESEHQRIWQRLYRVDQSRSEPGLGLGLSIVEAIAIAHGGRVEVESTPGEGSTFSLIIPHNTESRREGSASV